MALLAVALVNLVTNPVLNFAGTGIAQFTDWTELSAWLLVPILAAAEALVVLVEWRLLLWAIGGSARKMLLVAATMNAASAAAGLVFWAT